MSIGLAVFLAWVSVITFAPDLQASTILPGAPIAAEPPVVESGTDAKREVAVWDRAAAWVWSKQREFHRALTRELRNLRSQEGIGWALVLMSFLYGVLHAAGPGHGKAVLTTYLLTHRHRLSRGVAMGTTAALLQGVTALLLVYGLIGLAGWLPRDTEAASLWATRVSFVLLTIVGIYLLSRAALGMFRAVRHSRHTTGQAHHAHAHADHAHDEHCGCRHLPSAAEIDSAGDRRAAAGVVLAIGLRPCTGAVLVLILASVMDLVWHGALAVLAMSLGTAITVIVLAVLATKARQWASALVAHRSPLWALAGGGVGALGGALLLMLGLMLLSASFAMKTPLGV